MRTGHCVLSAHLKRTGILDTSLSAKKLTKPRTTSFSPAKRRQLTWQHGADLATKLWGSAEDLCWTVGFVASTGLSIWPGRLLIDEEEEDPPKQQQQQQQQQQQNQKHDKNYNKARTQLENKQTNKQTRTQTGNN